MRVILTADEGIYTENRGKWWKGYASCFPVEIIPPSLFSEYCPRISTANGARAPLSLRVIQSVMLDHFHHLDVECVDPRHIELHIKEDTKLLCVTAIDPMGLGYITRGILDCYGGVPYSRHLFSGLMRRIAKIREGSDLRIVVGGPGAWQLENSQIMDDLGIDFLVVGEGETVLPPLVEELIRESNTDKRVWKGSPPDGSGIRAIAAPSTYGMIETSRGCSRNCAFCATDSVRRDIDMDTITQSARVNVTGGVSDLTLQSDDPLTYRSRGFQPDEDAVIDMLREIKGAGARSISMLHTTFSSVAAAPDLIPSVEGVIGRNASRELQIGLETGSPDLVRRHMRGKCLPFSPEEWPEAVRSAVKILSGSGFSILATLILNLPGETPDDVRATRELLTDLKDSSIVFIPLSFFPMAPAEPREAPGRRVSEEQLLLIRQVRKHNLARAPLDLRQFLDLFPGSIVAARLRYG